jgi:hypothetical protein
MKRQLETGMTYDQYAVELNWRPGQRLNIDYLFGIQERKKEYGFADLLNENEILFAQRNVSTILNTLEATFVINNKMGINLRTRHYWSAVKNQHYFMLAGDGKLADSADQTFDLNQNYNAFTIDMIYRWIFMPGSELSLAWKTNTYMSMNQPEYNYIRNLKDSWQNQSNSLSLKMLFYLDYNQLFKSADLM